MVLLIVTHSFIIAIKNHSMKEKMKQVFAQATFAPGVMSGIRPDAVTATPSSSSSSPTTTTTTTTTTTLSAEDIDAISSLPGRTESDTFGSLAIPPGRLWGAQTQRSVMNFPIGGVECRMPMEVRTKENCHQP